MIYRLTATLDGRTLRKTIRACDSMDATFAAIKHVLDSAYADKSGPWAMGAVRLVGPDGRVLHTMDAKREEVSA